MSDRCTNVVHLAATRNCCHWAIPEWSWSLSLSALPGSPCQTSLFRTSDVRGDEGFFNFYLPTEHTDAQAPQAVRIVPQPGRVLGEFHRLPCPGIDVEGLRSLLEMAIADDTSSHVKIEAKPPASRISSSSGSRPRPALSSVFGF